MTAASELESAAVVEVEGRKRKTETRKNEAGKTAVKAVQKVEAQVVQVVQVVQLSARKGSTTATVTQRVTPATTRVASATAENATFNNAASLRASGLPVSVFSKSSRLFPTIQQISVRFRLQGPKRTLRASRAA